MNQTVLVVSVVSGALILGCLWGIYLPLSKKVEGFIVALAGGALIESVILELIEPSLRESTLVVVSIATLAGALVFSCLDYLVDEVWGQDSGIGLLAAISLDGIPENLALGVALLGVKPSAAASLAGAIFLSNLPEAAGGAKEMVSNNKSRNRTFFIWLTTALVLSLAAIAGNYLLKDVSPHFLAATRSFAAGAVVASLATEVFPRAFKDDTHWAGVATALGLVIAFILAN